MSVKVIQKVSLAVLKDGKMLMARSAKHQAVFFTPGGKIENGETERQALEREILEECGVGVIEKSIKFLKTFEAPAFGKKNTFVRIQLYSGELDGQPQASSEIAELKYFDSSIEPSYLTITGKLIFKWLKENNYII
ncbi:hypothetical protein A3H80_03095 [Candidatus Roizmanbacteria bacterium RIFCSPLOWO2_02_FULL_37_19]|uniref:Nudix hydrolase domain-containing protein n=1 Tax=Candidatus Roizmanbacteria bacterium RIFCSPHIGHO2_02_FULL_37_24 TaxID=1802037 RepID=A0A1F7GZ64_9BACT|nr:MAG: hypothetical protein A2862_04050 [Candidatus Roizmanbacteria bacterium RIFCSPHIGHO2_01_FULL_38_41]OGK24390.1 MAG: hypothetical protein A3C24_04500 [Candidatus Roizmanbacteria bacterium RIFCSPHIGHO2_02_FULL_37_24]OGK33983.1 MAG: hypothetical protein A3E10_04020 [Candidatus Roizmanbacteria bacterium RIFCSPHIGHO2_12_FULL_37_23]OGK43319.1 MAG: hypothetical protein A2956_03710 [Candidatus Roizmanbacteria bacterium RIFCSPLOWO2_01_FULL_37_57]OGK54071.1 MAG: hypothetical protein A3H80_03095 [Ca